MPIVTHLGFYQGQWLLWGETQAGEEKTTPGRGRRPKNPPVRFSPFDAADSLAEVIKAAGMETRALIKEKQPAVAWLPTVSGRPTGSSLLIAPPPAKDKKVEIRPWKVTVIPLPPREAIVFLAACTGRKTLAPGVIPGADITYWTQVLRFTCSLAAREKFIPGIVARDGRYCARWEPLIAGADLKALKTLSEGMPAACRAVTGRQEQPPAGAALPLLAGCIADLVDAVVRMAAEPGPTPAFDSIHDRWLYALQAPSGLLEAPAAELARFAAQVKEWQRKVFLLAGAPFRFCFRLEEPEPEDGEEWQIRYLLQAADDPSLLIPVKEAWQARGKKAGLFREKNFSVPEFVLAALGQAAGLCPRVENSLKTKVPAGYALDTDGAYEFLIEKAPFLEQAGFTVLVPSWWANKGTGLKLAARARVDAPSLRAAGGLSLDKVVAFNWEIALGGETLSREELENLAGMKSKLVKLRGQWVEVDADKIKAILKQMQKDTKITGREVVRLALGAGQAPGDLPFEGVQAGGWVADLLDRLEGRAPWQEVSPPGNLDGNLRPYQLRGYSWLHFLTRLGFGACLADDMGLGKTVQTLALIQMYREMGENRPVLLICPTSLVGNWQREAQRFTPELPVLVHHGPGRKRKSSTFKKEAAECGIVVSSYALLHRDIELLHSVNWAGVVLDEAQNIKNPHTKQARAARALEAGYKIALTGTPVENNVGDLWSLLEFLNPGLLGSEAGFKRHFFIPIQVNRDSRASERLKRITAPFILRRLKTDKTIISDLPEKMETKVFCTLTKEQASLYTAVINEVEEKLEQAEGIERRGLVLATLTKLKQICNHPAQFIKDGSSLAGRSGKMARLTEMCEEILSVGERALIFTQFAGMGEMLQKYLMEMFGSEALFLHGGLAKKERDRMVEIFQGDKGPPFFILSIKAGGTGLNLTGANHVFHFDRWWNPAVEDQATDRAFRIGQTKNVQVHKFVCAGTVEEKIDAMVEQKKEVAGRVVGTGEGWLAELSTSELKEIWALSREAIGE